MSPHIRSDFATARGLVPHHAPRTSLRPPSAASLHCTPCHSWLKPKSFVPLARAQLEGHQRFFSRRSQRHFGTEAPWASPEGFGFSPVGGTRGMLVGSNDRAIDRVHRPMHLPRGIGLRWDGLKEAWPDTGFSPTIEAAGHRAPGAIAFRSIAPGGTGAQHPQDAIDDHSMVRSGPAGGGFLRGKQRLEPLPLRVGEFFSFHTSECTPPSRVCKHALAM